MVAASRPMRRATIVPRYRERCLAGCRTECREMPISSSREFISAVTLQRSAVRADSRISDGKPTRVRRRGRYHLRFAREAS